MEYLTHRLKKMQDATHRPFAKKNRAYQFDSQRNKLNISGGRHSGSLVTNCIVSRLTCLSKTTLPVSTIWVAFSSK